MEQAEKVERLRAMLDHARALAHADDPILRGQGPILVGILADILRAEDPWAAGSHYVDDE